MNRVPYERLPELDRWALMQLDHLIERVRRAYEDFEFHVIFHELNNFCSVQMSATYFDVLKDRLYTFGKNSTPRRGSQTALFDILTGVTQLMAPILAFTSEEIWQVIPETQRAVGSVHLAPLPKPDRGGRISALESAGSSCSPCAPKSKPRSRCNAGEDYRSAA